MDTLRFIFDVGELYIADVADELFVDPSSLLRATLTHLLFDDDTDLRYIARVAQSEEEAVSPENIIDIWYGEHLERLVALFTPLMAHRPFKWKKVSIVDDFASIEVAPLD